jgi:hypothetical protein
MPEKRFADGCRLTGCRQTIHVSLWLDRTYLVSREHIQPFVERSAFRVFRLAFLPNRSDECVVRCTRQKENNDEHARNDGKDGNYKPEESESMSITLDTTRHRFCV